MLPLLLLMEPCTTGQSCCGIERVYVHTSVYKDFVRDATKIVNEYVLGDPLAATTSMGPIALPVRPQTLVILRHPDCSPSFFLQNTPDHLTRLVQDAIMKGATLCAGGKTLKDASGNGRSVRPFFLFALTDLLSDSLLLL